MAFRIKDANVFGVLIYRDFWAQIFVVVRLLVVTRCVERLLYCTPDMSVECHVSLSVCIVK
jgi:hypothetical protein